MVPDPFLMAVLRPLNLTTRALAGLTDLTVALIPACAAVVVVRR